MAQGDLYRVLNPIGTLISINDRWDLAVVKLRFPYGSTRQYEAMIPHSLCRLEGTLVYIDEILTGGVHLSDSIQFKSGTGIMRTFWLPPTLTELVFTV